MTQTAYNLLIEEYPLSEKFITEKDSNKYEFEGWVTKYKGVGRFILGLIGEIDSIEPNTLREHLNSEILKKEF